MRKILAFLACAGLAGCSWLGLDSGDSNPPQSEVVEVTEEVVVPAQNQASAPAATPAPAAASPAKKPAAAKKASPKSATSEAKIRDELEQVGRKLSAQAKRTITPSKANPQVKKVGKEYVATYTDVDADHVTTELRPGKDGHYIGFIRYQEHVYECKGSTEKAARSATCTVARSRRVNELIVYDGKKWNY